MERYIIVPEDKSTGAGITLEAAALKGGISPITNRLNEFSFPGESGIYAGRVFHVRGATVTHALVRYERSGANYHNQIRFEGRPADIQEAVETIEGILGNEISLTSWGEYFGTEPASLGNPKDLVNDWEVLVR